MNINNGLNQNFSKHWKAFKTKASGRRCNLAAIIKDWLGDNPRAYGRLL